MSLCSCGWLVLCMSLFFSVVAANGNPVAASFSSVPTVLRSIPLPPLQPEEYSFSFRHSTFAHLVGDPSFVVVNESNVGTEFWSLQYQSSKQIESGPEKAILSVRNFNLSDPTSLVVDLFENSCSSFPIDEMLVDGYPGQNFYHQLVLSAILKKISVTYTIESISIPRIDFSCLKCRVWKWKRPYEELGRKLEYTVVFELDSSSPVVFMSNGTQSMDVSGTPKEAYVETIHIRRNLVDFGKQYVWSHDFFSMACPFTNLYPISSPIQLSVSAAVWISIGIFFGGVITGLGFMFVLYACRREKDEDFVLMKSLGMRRYMEEESLNFTSSDRYSEIET